MWSAAFHSLLQFILGPSVSVGGWGGEHALGACGYVMGFVVLFFCLATVATRHLWLHLPMCSVSTPVTWLSLTTHWPLWQESSLCLFSLWAQEVPIIWFLPFSSELWAASMAPISAILHSLLLAHSYMLTFRCFNAGISQMCLCAEHGILCWIIAAQIIVTSRGATRGTSYNTIPLMSFSWHFIFVFSLFQVFSSSVFIFMPFLGVIWTFFLEFHFDFSIVFLEHFFV